ncbi:hypothetical protein [Vibrio sp. ER1A]|uniref:hypothetical protein n=1 Tax=Vibrio sp. ER1A TaxID=1517681 RepID=UPI0004DD39EA|nr:hypothetical protein [Vibrio sp. ER1A]KFA99235.1 hypothetical protein HW45_05035 [Vibrio sp. ER1A]
MTDIILSDNEFIISDVKVKHNTPSFYTESINGKGNALSRGLHSMEIEAKITCINDLDIKKFEALMLRIRGRLNPFKLSLQDSTDGKGYCNPLFTDVKPMTATAVSIGQTKLTLSGFSGEIPAGSKFQFPNDSKVYVLLTPALPNREVEIFPAVRFAQVIKTRMNFSPEPLVRLNGDVFDIQYANGAEYSLKMKEVM